MLYYKAFKRMYYLRKKFRNIFEYPVKNGVTFCYYCDIFSGLMKPEVRYGRGRDIYCSGLKFNLG